jgi:hypothetical protein
MYSDEELDAAAAAGAISAESVAAFRRFVGGYRTAPDEEQFRLLTGFNDIFIAIAVIVFLIAVAWLAARVSMLAGGAAVAGLSWGLAEYFTRQRRLALPSIVLALGFILGAAFLLTAAVSAAFKGLGVQGPGGAGGPATVAIIAALLAGVIYVHWWRFHVPITVALCATSTIGALLWLLIGFFPSLKSAIQPLVLLGGLVLFAAAMSWDMRDPLRTTRRTDIAFWLHLAAAPLIVHGVFALFGVLTPGGARGAGDWDVFVDDLRGADYRPPGAAHRGAGLRALCDEQHRPQRRIADHQLCPLWFCHRRGAADALGFLAPGAGISGKPLASAGAGKFAAGGEGAEGAAKVTVNP